MALKSAPDDMQRDAGNPRVLERFLPCFAHLMTGRETARQNGMMLNAQ
jgi:hypothetical protein